MIKIIMMINICLTKCFKWKKRKKKVKKKQISENFVIS